MRLLSSDYQFSFRSEKYQGLGVVAALQRQEAMLLSLNPLVKQARNRLRDASEAFERNKWNEAVSILQETSELYERSFTVGGKVDESEEMLKSTAMVRLTRSFGAFALILSLGSDDSERVLQLSHAASEDLRLAAVLFEKAGLKEEATYARSLLELSRAKFYEEHEKRQLQAFDNEKAAKYLRNAVTSSNTAIKMLLQASFSRLLERDRTHETIRKLERQSNAWSERIQSLERSLAEINEELTRYKKRFTLAEESHELIPDLKALAKTTARSLRYAKFSSAIIAILIVFYFALVVTSSFHITSVFDTALLLSAIWVASTGVLIVKQTRQLRTSTSDRLSVAKTAVRAI